MRRLDGVLSVLVKLSKGGGNSDLNWPSKAVALGEDGEDGVLQQAHDFASLHIALLLDAARVTTTACRVHGMGGARGGYTNVYNRLSDKEVGKREIANAYVALAEVERGLGMAAEAARHLTMAGDMLIQKHDTSKHATATGPKPPFAAAGDSGGGAGGRAAALARGGGDGWCASQQAQQQQAKDFFPNSASSPAPATCGAPGCASL